MPVWTKFYYKKKHEKRRLIDGHCFFLIAPKNNEVVKCVGPCTDHDTRECVCDILGKNVLNCGHGMLQKLRRIKKSGKR